LVTFVRGNIFESSAQIITNTVNCVGVMGAGLALEFKNKFPEMFNDYKTRCQKNEVVAGKPYLWENDKVQILNFPTKRHWQDKSLLNDIEDGLRYLATQYQEMGIQSLALPPLGCGLGGLSWDDDVKPLIEKYLGSLSDLEIYVYEPSVTSEKSNRNNQRDLPSSARKDDVAASSL